MKRRPARYTLLIAKSGGGSRALSFPASLLFLVLALGLGFLALHLYLLHRGREAAVLEARLRALSQEARRLSLELEAERAKNGALAQEAERTRRELEELKKAIEELRRRAGLAPLNALPVRYVPGGQGGGGMEGWLAIRTEVLDLRQQLRELAPALERALELERSRPSGLPLRAYTGIASPFGMRRNPFGPGLEFHEGLDLAAPYGAPVYATASGVVARAGWMGPYGLAVYVEHLGGYATLYGHLSRLAVRPGERVERGQLLGYVGSTGRSTGPHLHYGLYRQGVAVDPTPYLGPAWAAR